MQLLDIINFYRSGYLFISDKSFKFCGIFSKDVFALRDSFISLLSQITNLKENITHRIIVSCIIE